MSPPDFSVTSCEMIIVSRCRVDAERLEHGLHSRHVSLVVGAPEVDHAVEAPALELVPVVCNVRREIGRLAGGPHQHVVFVVSQGRRREPRCAVALDGVTALGERCHRPRVAAVVVQIVLAEPDVEPDADAFQVRTDGVDHTVDAHGAELPHPVGPLHRQEPVAEIFGKLTA